MPRLCPPSRLRSFDNIRAHCSVFIFRPYHAIVHPHASKLAIKMEVTPPCSVIETVWPTIWTFLNLEDSISMSRTSRKFHEAIVDSNTRKLKVSSYTWDSENTPVKSRRHLYRALNVIDFASLESLELLGFSLITGASFTTFSSFASNLAYAKNLKCLGFSLDICNNVYDGRVSSMVRELGQSLIQCSQLSDLKVWLFFGNPKNELDFMQALTPTIEKRKQIMSSIRFRCPSPCLDDRSLAKRDDIAERFFAAIVFAKNLRVLDLYWNERFTPGLERAVKQANKSGVKPIHLRELGLNLGSGCHELKGCILWYFSECSSLEKLKLDLWEHHMDYKMIVKLITNKPLLKELTIDFQNLPDEDDEAMKLLEDYAKSCNFFTAVALYNLHEVCPDRLSSLIANLNNKGMRVTMNSSVRVRNGRVWVFKLVFESVKPH